jgi:hypothetical protein
MVKPSTVQTVLSVALSHAWSIHQLDVKNSFLRGTLSETVYCMQPSGFVDSAHPDHVCHLNRSLYGLKQAPVPSRLASHLISCLLALLVLGPTLIYLSIGVVQSLHTCSYMWTTSSSLCLLIRCSIGSLMLSLQNFP